MTKNIIKKNLNNLEPSATLAINEKSKKLILKGKNSVMLISKKVLTKISSKDRIKKEDPNKINVFKFSLLGFNIFKLFIIFPL